MLYWDLKRNNELLGNMYIEEFISSQIEDDLWKIIDDYEKWRETGEIGTFLSKKALELRDHPYYGIYGDIALYAYRYFALKYRKTMK